MVAYRISLVMEFKVALLLSFAGYRGVLDEITKDESTEGMSASLLMKHALIFTDDYLPAKYITEEWDVVKVNDKTSFLLLR